MQFRAMLRLTVLILHILQSLAWAKASWKKVPVSGTYPGRGETALSRCGGNKVCLLGGRGANLVNILDTDSLAWSVGQSGSFQMHHFQGFQGPDNCVWVAGAWTGGYPNEATVNNIWRYCPDSNKWFKDAAIPRPRGSGGAVYHNGKVYLVTGNVGGHRKGAKVVRWFDSYDPKTGKWARLPDIPHARDHCHAVVQNNKLYVAGGRRSTSNAPEFFDDTVLEVDMYDFETGKWNTISKLGHARGGTAAAVHDNKVYLLGGEGSNRAWTEVDVLEGATFKPGPSLPEPRHGTGVVSCDGAMWIAGGARVQGGGNNAKDTYAFFNGDRPPVCSFKERLVSEEAFNESMEDATPVAYEEETGVSNGHGSNQNGSSLDTTPQPWSPSPTAIHTPEVSPVEVPEHSPLSKPDKYFSGAVPSPSPGTSPVMDITATTPEVSTPVMDFMTSASPDVEPAPTQASDVLEVYSPEPLMMSSGPLIGPTPFMVLPEVSGNNSPSPSLAATISSEDASPMEQESGSPGVADLSKQNVTQSPVVRSPDSSPITIVVSEADSTQPGRTPPGPSSSSSSSVGVLTQPSILPSSPSQDVIGPAPSINHQDPVGETKTGVNKDDENEVTKGSVSSATGQSSSAILSIAPDEPARGVSDKYEVPTVAEQMPRPSDAAFAELEGASVSPGMNEWDFDSELEVSGSAEFDDETSSCFPSNAVVELEDGSKKAMGLLRIGDRVRVAHPNEFSEVFFFSHKHGSKKSGFVRIETCLDGAELTVSPGHLVYVNGKVVKASTVGVGDMISVAHDSRSATVTNVSRVRGLGLHNPHTLHGDIVVNGVVASTFTSSVHPRLAKVLLAPFKAAFFVFKARENVEELNRVVLRALDVCVWRE